MCLDYTQSLNFFYKKNAINLELGWFDVHHEICLFTSAAGGSWGSGTVALF